MKLFFLFCHILTFVMLKKCYFALFFLKVFIGNAKVTQRIIYPGLFVYNSNRGSFVCGVHHRVFLQFSYLDCRSFFVC